MVKYTLIVEYLLKGNNYTQVATLCSCSRMTVWYVLKRIDYFGFSLENIKDIGEEELRKRLRRAAVAENNQFFRQPIGITNTPSSRLYPYCVPVMMIFRSGKRIGHCFSVLLYCLIKFSISIKCLAPSSIS